MAAQDTVTKQYLRDVHHFADAFNYFLFDGKAVIDPARLSEEDSTELGVFLLEETDSEANHYMTAQKFRDLFKNMLLLTDKSNSYLLLGIENQTELDLTMPVRTMIYDSLRYAGFYDMTLEEKLDWTARRIPALERLRSFEFATGTAGELWLENLNYQIDYFTRLLRQLEDSKEF